MYCKKYTTYELEMIIEISHVLLYWLRLPSIACKEICLHLTDSKIKNSKKNADQIDCFKRFYNSNIFY